MDTRQLTLETAAETELLSREEFMARLEAVLTERYHHQHPFHLLMHEGRLTKGQLQAWALNRYYYQSVIPRKDAIVLSRADDPEFRRAWRKRIVDHDGSQSGEGGIERWIQLAEATGLDRARVMSCSEILPGVRFAVEAYLHLVSRGSFLEAVASSLTEMFSYKLIALRIDRLQEHYPWLSHGLSYFTARLTQAPEDAEFASNWAFMHAPTRHEQELAIAALRRKCDILWAQLDALYYSYVTPGWVPPGAFKPETE
ncbi:MAG: pyrroloquinoline-quinone synthase PqqC [Candidatus Korobacteraceae bacterium]|jgi:pyrroloquinoline-quinone synthase